MTKEEFLNKQAVLTMDISAFDNKEKEKEKDNINPDHYKSSTSLECIEAMEIAYGREAVIHFCLCNAFKYVWRWKNKNGQEDLNKANWYIQKGMNLVNDLETSPSLKHYFSKFAGLGIYVTTKLIELEDEDDTAYIIGKEDLE